MSNSFQSFIWKKDDAVEPVSPGPAAPMRKLLPGEVGGISCDDVSFYFQFHDVLTGRLTCTNFCLYFQPHVVANRTNRVPQRFTVFDDDLCVPLCSIESISYSTVHQDVLRSATKKKYRQLTSSVSSLEIVSCLKLYLKDFRVLTLDMSRSQHAPNMANQLLFFSRPSTVEHLVQAGANVDWIARVAFNDEDSWRQELNRCCAKEGWRVCNVRRELLHYVIHSYPTYVVVPRDLVGHDLGEMVDHYREGRFPVWVWSSSNGTSLLRSSMFEDNYVAARLSKKYLSMVPGVSRTTAIPHQLYVEVGMTPARISASYHKLHKLCSIDSYELLASRDRDWLSRVNDTGWLRLVLYCQQMTSQAISWMLDRGRSVIICEMDDMDLSAVVSSLVQICCDSHYRTAGGLEQLINKDWIALGHPFGQRLLRVGGGQKTGGTEQPEDAATTPTFLLFLDCVAQLRRLYPMQFNYSDHLLIALWDLSLTGLVPALACSSVNEQLASGRTGGPFPLTRFYTEDYRNLFSNVVNDAAQVIQRTKTNSALTGFSNANEEPKSLFCDVIRPPTLPLDIELWDACYMRWIPPANVKNGGEVQRDIALDGLMTTISNRTNQYWRPQFGQVDGERISSAYPYSVPVAEHRRMTDLLDDTDDVSSMISFSSMSVREKKPHMNLSYDTSMNESNLSDEHRASFSMLEDDEVIVLRPSDHSAQFTRTPVRNAPQPPRAENKPALRPSY